MRLRILLLATVAATAIGIMAVSPSNADTFNAGDHVYADSFGNLVVDSAAGYKRIIVGQGHRAKELQAFTASETPEVIYADRGGAKSGDCYRPGQWLQGRSYMYGRSFEDGPYIAPCR